MGLWLASPSEGQTRQRLVMALSDRSNRQGRAEEPKRNHALIGKIQCIIIANLHHQLDLYYRDSPEFSIIYGNMLAAQKVILQARGSSRARSPLPLAERERRVSLGRPWSVRWPAETQDGAISGRSLTMAFLSRAEAAALQFLIDDGAAPTRLRHPIGRGNNLSTHGPIPHPRRTSNRISAEKRTDTPTGARDTSPPQKARFPWPFGQGVLSPRRAMSPAAIAAH